ncbi:Transcriptional regulatory protein, C terminal [Serratia fonticola]|uniref:Transcriptional regulatory protein, C terminal n=1 Tax=Serratia fonticola TaxID=47917 RepID=A0A4U9WJ47_SERFO|nr:Transcriptional regulatory protein, C terminal [Serratia fonticola]
MSFSARIASVFIIRKFRKKSSPFPHLQLDFSPFLLKIKEKLFEREVLLQKVWDDYGLQASNNNLNQCLSTLRRIIKSMGIDKNIIETIPKVGLRIASDVAIEEIAINQGEPELPRKEKKNFLSKVKITYVLIALVIILTVTTVVHIFHIYQHYYQSDANVTL